MTDDERTALFGGTAEPELDVVGETEWARLRNLLELAEGGWFAFLFASNPADVHVFRERTRRMLRARAAALLAFEPVQPAMLLGLLELLGGPEATEAGVVWAEALAVDPVPSGPWASAWEQVMLRLNERRDSLRRHLRGGLLFALSPSLKPLVRDAAPDLWSMRSLVIELPLRRSAGFDFPRAEAPVMEAVGALNPMIAEPVNGPPELTRGFNEVAAALAAGRTGTAVALARELYESVRTADDETRRAALIWLSHAEEADGDYAAAADHVDAALAISGGGQSRVVLLTSAANAALRDGDVGEVARRLAEVVDLLREHLAAEPDDVLGARVLVASLNGLGRARQMVGETERARAAFEEAVVRARVRARHDAAPEAIRELRRSLVGVGDVQRATGDLAEAATAYEEALVLHRGFVERVGATPESLRDLAVSLRLVGDARRETGDITGATAAYEEALLINRQLTEQEPAPAALRDLVASLERLGMTRLVEGNVAAAVATYEESLDLTRRLVAETGDSPEALLDLVRSLVATGFLRRISGDVAGSAAAHDEALVLAPLLVEQAGDRPEILRDLSANLRRAANIRFTEDVATAAAMYEEVLRIQRRILDRFGRTKQALEDYSETLARAAEIWQAHGDVVRAKAVAGELEEVRLELDARSEIEP